MNDKKMFLIKMMTDRVEGYKNIAYVNTVDEANERINALKVYYKPIDIYYKQIF